MDDYPYATLGVDGWLHCDGFHPPGFPMLLQDVLHCFGYMGTLTYRGHPYREFGHSRCEVHVDILTHPSNPSMMAWFTTAEGDDLDDALERVAHQALMEFCECHLPGLDGTAVALLPVRNEGNTVWSERLAAVGNPERETYHAGWAFTACYSQHVSSLIQEATATGAFQHMRLEEYDDRVQEQNRTIQDIQKGNRELLQENHHLEV
jgi:hypothetical protein